MHNVAESTYNAAKRKAERCGYLSVEEYVSAWLDDGASLEIPMSPELALALEEGLADSRTGEVISLDELNRRHAEQRTSWILVANHVA